MSNLLFEDPPQIHTLRRRDQAAREGIITSLLTGPKLLTLALFQVLGEGDYRAWEPYKAQNGESLALRLEPHPRHPNLECVKKTDLKDNVTQCRIFLQCTQLVLQVPSD